MLRRIVAIASLGAVSGVSACAAPVSQEADGDQKVEQSKEALNWFVPIAFKAMATYWNASPKCIDVPGYSVPAGATRPANLYTCHGGTAQQFQMIEAKDHQGVYYKLQHVSTGTCLRVVDGSNALVAGSCDVGSFYQPDRHAKFYFDDPTNAQDSRSRMRAGLNGYCVDVPSGIYENGRPLQVYPCHNGPNQTFWVYNP